LTQIAGGALPMALSGLMVLWISIYFANAARASTGDAKSVSLKSSSRKPH